MSSPIIQKNKLLAYINKIERGFTEEEKKLWIEHIPKYVENKSLYTLLDIIITVEGDSIGKYTDKLVLLVENPEYRKVLVIKLIIQGRTTKRLLCQPCNL
jgi:hypothetical protein